MWVGCVLDRIEAHCRRTDTNHLLRTVQRYLADAGLLIFECHALVLLSGNPELGSHLRSPVFGTLFEKIGTGIPAQAAADATLSIYYHVDNEIISTFIELY